jgi:F-type H+-transporting ATPase subunit b
MLAEPGRTSTLPEVSLLAASRRWTVAASSLWAVGLPAAASAADLNLYPNPILVGANVAVFLLLVYPTMKLVVGPLSRILEERDRRGPGARAEADGLRAEAAELHGQYEARMREAHTAAQARRAAILGKAADEQRQLLDRARQEAGGVVESVRGSIAVEAAAARDALRTEARALAREAAARILGRAL